MSAVGFTEITTPRLRLRRLRPDDAPVIHGYRALPAIARFQIWRPANAAEVRRFIRKTARVRPGTEGTWLQLGIEARESGALLGDCGLHFPVGLPQQAEVGITLARPHQGQGYATEALAAVLDYLFLRLRRHRVFASVDPGNRPCRRLLRRLGLRQEAHFRQSLRLGAAWVDDVIYAMLARDWPRRRPPHVRVRAGRPLSKSAGAARR